MNVLVTAAVLGLVSLWFLASGNRLVRLRRQVASGWMQIDVQRRRRHDLVLTLVSTLSGAMERGQHDALDAVAAARGRAAGAAGPADAGPKEDELSFALARVLALTAGRPPRGASQDVRTLREELAAVEHALGAARRSYNEFATRYNAALEVAPASLIAAFAGFRRAGLFGSASDTGRAGRRGDGSLPTETRPSP